MSTARFLEHNGERIPLDAQRIVEELRCDLCGEFTDADDAIQVNIQLWQHGVSVAPALTLDAHPSCARQLSSRTAETIDRVLAARS